MKEIIIIKTDDSARIKAFLDQKKANYKVFNQTRRKKDLFVNYQEAVKDKEREKEISLLDQVQEEEDEENEDWEWYDD